MKKKTDKKKYYLSWTLSDELWEKIKIEIPQRKRDKNKKYKNKPGQGRKPIPPRKVLEGILYVLRTGCQWKAVPKEYGAGSSIHKYFQEWEATGFFEKLWVMALEEYDKEKGIGWEWQSVDGCMVKAPLAREAVGHNPTDRGKMGTKRSVLTDEKGIPLSVVLDGANRHDIKLLEKTLNNMVKFKSEITDNTPQNLCLDAGYTGAEKIISDKKYVLHIRPRGEEKEEKIKNPNFKARRWVVEVTHSFFNRFRKLLVRYEKKARNYLALIHFACAIIVWRKIIPVHKQ